MCLDSHKNKTKKGIEIKEHGFRFRTLFANILIQSTDV